MSNLNYGVIGNCKTAALVSDRGSIDWLCFPYFDSSSVFAKILDEKKGGSLSFSVSDDYQITQEYLKDTNILCTRFTAPEGTFEVLDFMPRYRTSQNEYYLSPEVYRYIRLITGKPSFTVVYDLKMNYAQETTSHKKFKDYIISYSSENIKDNIYLYSNFNFDDILEEKEIVLQEDSYLLLSYRQKLIPINIERIYLEYQRTKVYWLNWSNRSRKLKDYNDWVSRSLLVLKLMSFQNTGAVLAAITTSIPETIGEVRNWDYRFCWLRDASMSIKTLLKLGHSSAARRYMGFVKGILKSKSDSFQIMYSIHGERNLEETTLDHLAGYENTRPVRIGNEAYKQNQNDSLGYLMDVIYSYYLYFPGPLDEIEEMWEMVKTIAKSVFMQWREPDNGIWEFRERKDHFVFSKVMCWVALDRAVQIASYLGNDDYADRWRREADIIKNEILTEGWNEKIQSFTQAYKGEEVDASLLLMEYYGFLKPEDEKYIKTVERVKEELLYKGLMFRYKNKDDFGKPRSAFTICTFWLVRALHVIGHQQEALGIFKELLDTANHLYLLSEDLDFETRRQLGNFPQAYSHLALIDTSLLFTEEMKRSRFIHP